MATRLPNPICRIVALVCACVLLSVSGRSLAEDGRAPAIVTTVFIVRHAQKADPKDNSPDSPLSEQGKQAADHLAAALRSTHLDAVFATPTVRARDTARPAATFFGVEVTEYRPGAPEELAALIQSRWAGRSALVVGHSNTVPALVRALGGAAEGDLGSDEYDNLFIVTITDLEGARSVATTRLHLAL